MLEIKEELIPYTGKAEQREVVVPDQIFSEIEVEYLEATAAVFAGVPGYEWVDEALEKSNWPPDRSPLSKLKEEIDLLRFRIEHPYADRALRAIESPKERK